MEGSAIDSTSLSYTIKQHDLDSYRQFTFDLTQASIASDTNPFVAASGSPTVVATAAGAAATGSSSSSSSSGGDDASKIILYEKAHGIVMGVTVVLLFPIGAILMRTIGGVWIHASFQIFSLMALIAGFGLGVKLSKLTMFVSRLSQLVVIPQLTFYSASIQHIPSSALSS